MSEKFSVVVTLTKPDDFSKRAMVGYVRDAVQSHAGAFEPGHPLFGKAHGFTARPANADEVIAEATRDTADQGGKLRAAEERIRALEAKLEEAEGHIREMTSGDHPFMHPVQVLHTVVRHINLIEHALPSGSRAKEREFFKAGARQSLALVNKAIQATANEIIDNPVRVNDGHLFSFWTKEAYTSPGAVAKALYNCVTPQDYRDALTAMMQANGEYFADAGGVNDEGNVTHG